MAYEWAVIVDRLITLSGMLPERACLAGLDHGTRTIGVAVSDDGRRVAAALTTIRRTKFTRDAEALTGILSEYRIAGIVLGLPLNMDGSEGRRCQSVRQFAENLSQKTDLPIAFWDERLSSRAVERQLIAHDVSRRRRAAAIDRMAAQFILQGALDHLALGSDLG